MSADIAEQDARWMRRAIELSARGRGSVEPNPMVGCVIVQNGEVIGEGWHQEFGGAHAEVNALQQCSVATDGATAYVTLEPCCHHGKTPPCTEALIRAGITRVVIAHPDPFSEVSGNGIVALRNAGIEIEMGVLKQEASSALSPYLYRIREGLPWLIAKWAMTLDGRIATKTGDSQWISNEHSRAKTHLIRGQVDGVMVGIGTALADDPFLTPRPSGPRIASRIVIDSKARLPLDCKLVQTASEYPCLIAVGPEADPSRCEKLAARGCQVWQGKALDPQKRLKDFLKELASDGMTNLLVEGGGALLGSLFDSQLICEAHVFIAPKIIGGDHAIAPIGGIGINQLSDSQVFSETQIDVLDGDIHFSGRLMR
ncbi:MAG: bifunctional diaminohydroxyphosphoribosylaminopyrimidine deaminase/5-amino-6-(5-phosphoribosylamino)uracil reductase RibD [Mariniblastus sp.]|nr:bifunctional diaminohydroxyphosphoribosylaminopyrimidine deaminase/5-amino-6-(5-phosphoribosylamino)uracil reductase RibD [Mariniblastus sp.]